MKSAAGVREKIRSRSATEISGLVTFSDCRKFLQIAGFALSVALDRATTGAASLFQTDVRMRLVPSSPERRFDTCRAERCRRDCRAEASVVEADRWKGKSRSWHGRCSEQR